MPTRKLSDYIPQATAADLRAASHILAFARTIVAEPDSWDARYQILTLCDEDEPTNAEPKPWPLVASDAVGLACGGDGWGFTPAQLARVALNIQTDRWNRWRCEEFSQADVLTAMDGAKEIVDTCPVGWQSATNRRRFDDGRDNADRA